MAIELKTLEDFVHGDHGAFYSIFKLYYPRVRAFIYGFIKNTNDAEELTQIVFIKLWDKRESFLHVNHFDSYLFTLIKNTVLNYMATRNAMMQIGDDVYMLEKAGENTPHEELVAKDLQLLIDMIVDSMPPQRKLIYRLSRSRGLSNEQIADKLGIQKKTVENHLNLALKEIKKAVLVCFIFFNASNLGVINVPTVLP